MTLCYTRSLPASSWTERRWHLGQTAGQPIFGTPATSSSKEKSGTARLRKTAIHQNPSMGWKTLFFKDTPHLIWKSI